MVNVAIIGLGWWGKIMVRTLASSSRVRVVAAVEPSEAGGPFCLEHGIVHLQAYAQALAHPGVDAVVLTTPNRLHEQQIIEAARAGKHVFCEKPLALSLASAERAMAACLEHDVRLGIGHERRFEPPVQMIRTLLEAGELGRLLQIEANFSQNKFLALPPDNWRLSTAEAGCGPMTATGIHLLDLACSLAGPALTVCASSSNLSTGFESGDSASAQLTFAGGVTASINAMLTTPFFSRFAVFGSRGWIEVHDKSHVESPSGWTVRRCLGDAPVETIDVAVAEPVRTNLEAFADAVEAGQARYPVGLQEMLNTTSALEAVFEAVTRREIVRPRASRLLDNAATAGVAETL